MKKLLTEGTRIYYDGDMVNYSAFGTIKTVITDQWGTHYKIYYDDGRETIIDSVGFSDEYKGHGGTRFVTVEAYNKFRNCQLREMGYSEEKIMEYEAI